jgi:hypothetical protein
MAGFSEVRLSEMKMDILVVCFCVNRDFSCLEWSTKHVCVADARVRFIGAESHRYFLRARRDNIVSELHVSLVLIRGIRSASYHEV